MQTETMLVQSGGHEPVRTPSIAPTFSMQNSSRSTKEQANDKGNALFSAAPARPHMMQPFMTPQKSGSASYSTPQNRSQLSSNVESLRLQQAAVPATPKRLVPNPTNIAIPPATLALPKKNYEHNVPGVRASGHVSGSPVSSQGRIDITERR